MIAHIYIDIGQTDLTGEHYVLVEDEDEHGYLVSDSDREEARSLFGERLRRVDPDFSLLAELEEPCYASGRIDGFAYIEEDGLRGGYSLFVYGQSEEVPLSADETKTILYAGDYQLQPDY